MDQHQLAAEIEAMVNRIYLELIRLPDADARVKRTAEAWSLKEIIGHLIDSASNNHQRWVRLQITDVLHFPEYQKYNEEWIRIQRYNEQPWQDLLGLWSYFNLHLSRMVRGVKEECLEHRWVLHEGGVMTLRELMTGYLEHLKIHFEQIQKTMRT
jgi:hypothetical protein